MIRRWLDHLERRARQRVEERVEEGHFALIRHAVIPDPFPPPAPDGWLAGMAAEQSAWAGRTPGGAV